VVEVKTYTAEVQRDGKFWLIRVPEIDRSTQALRYRDVVAMASDLIEIMEGVESDDYDLHLKVVLPDAVKDHLARAEVLREEARRANAESAKESREAVKQLLAQGLSQREAGDVLGMSFQRVNQLVNS
jgi:DNA-directed RNA polymerase specialized sigma24 family protein